MNSFLAQFLTVIRLRPFVSGCLALALARGGANFFLWRGRQGATRQHDEVRQRGEHLINALSDRPRVDTDVAALRVALRQIEQNLFDEQSMEVNLGYFYRLEKITRVHLIRVNQLAALAPAPGSEHKALPFSMQLSGSYRNSMAFLHALETGPHVLRIRSCNFERMNPDSSDVMVELNVEILAKA